MLLSNAVLVIPNFEKDAYIAIPVINFPVLPVGSEIDLKLTEKAFFEDAVIVAYRVNYRHGVEVELDLKGRPETANEDYVDKRWNEIATVCPPDESLFLCERLYRGRINFNKKYPLTSRRKRK